ncbi:MAG: glycerol-3-phosphate 1-O-acyltransferase PlsY [Pseudomonadota bacterium]|nr:glycerol-3-phosphate 1-O-acyltransferase PlsY [Pseudomonadota bacterium]
MADILSQITVAPLHLGGVALGAYLLGAVPFGLLLTRLAGLGDVRKIGSGNIGATNVLRTGRKDLAAATLLLDGAKGAVAVLVADSLYGQNAEIIAAIFAFLGHLFPVWLGFRGGKGVATFLGVSLALHPLTGIAACATWLVVALVFRYSSLAALVMAALTPVYAFLLVDHLRMELALVLGAFVWLKHRANIQRLLTGDEPRIGGRGKGGG